MKTINYLMMAIFMMAATFTSCSDDDNDNDGKTTPNNSIIGKWVVKNQIVADVETNSKTNDAIIKKDIEENYSFFNEMTWTFNTNNTVDVIDEEGETKNSPYKLEGDKLTVTYGSDDIHTYIVSIENEILSITIDCLDKFKDIELDYIINLGIKDPFDFEVKSATAKTDCQRAK